MSKRSLALVVGFLLIAALGLLPRQVRAQTITINTGSQATQLVDASGSSASRSYQPDKPFWVNHAECEAGWQYKISVTTDQGMQGQVLEVWASSSGDCSATTSRYGVTSSACWKLLPTFGSWTVGYGGSTTLMIPAQNLVAARTNASNDPNFFQAGTAADCNPANHAGGSVPSTGVAVTIFIYGFVGVGNNATPTVTATWTNAGYDLIGPTAPTTVSAAAADTELYMNWSQVVATDLAGYHIYCKAPDGNVPDAGALSAGGASSTGGAGSTGGAAAGAAATGGGTSTADAGLNYNASCPDSQILQGAFPSGMTPSGSATDKLATSGIASGLTNGQQYACAVAAYDTRQNDGPFSAVQCGTPWYVDDFYSVYRKAGGKAGGGFCTIGHAGSAIGFLIPLASIAMFALRRRRRNR
jgi:hypothetical protein